MGSDISLSKAVRANLLSLQNTAEMMNKTQNRLATGNKVNSALDNPSNFFTASALNSRAADMSNLLDSMASGIKVIEAANNGITALTKNLESMQSTLRQARQDKSFQTQSFEVSDNTVLKLGGGQFGDVPTEIKLADATAPGIKSQVSTTSDTAYLGPVSSNSSASGAGARTEINLNGAISTGETFTVAGVTVTAGADVTDTGVAASIQSALNLDPATVGKYTASAGTGDNAGKIIIETVDTTAEAAEVVFQTADSATKGKTTFNYSAITSSVSVGSQPISTGSSFEEFVGNLEAGAAAGNYEVEADADTGVISLISKDFGAAAPTISGVPQNGAGSTGTPTTTSFTLANGTAGSLRDDQELTIAGADAAIELTSGMNAAAIKSALEADEGLDALYTVAVDATTLAVTLTSKTNGAAAATVTSDKAAVTMVPATLTTTGSSIDLSALAADIGTSNPGAVFTISDGTATSATHTLAAGETVQDLLDGLNGGNWTVSTNADGFEITSATGDNFTLTITGAPGFGLPAASTSTGGIPAEPAGIGAVTSTAGTADTAAVNGYTSVDGLDRAWTNTVAAEKDEFTVSYDGKTAEISIGAVKGGVGTSANALDVKNWQDATVADVNNQLANQGILGVEAQFDDAGKLAFVAKTAEAKTLAVSGTDATALFGTNGVHTGQAEKSELNSTKTVDKFVELINRDMGGQVRASNDNGKLRIENLSTQSLDIGIDTGGAMSSLKVDGNSVRANLSKQFNELRDQLDKLSDDASFNGINLLRGDKLKITFNESGTSSIDIQAKDRDGNVRGINASNLNIDTLVAEDLDTDEKIDAFLATLSSALTELRSQASSFGSNLSSVENRQSFTKNMINTLETGAANLTLADTNEEAANLLALQTRQQLSSSALSMASQQDQAVLQLLR
ncbi:MAG: hypothetical protein IR164_17615 [Devosia sp.]|uniref:flagellin N-terminal helical domain-containing protein n=1 Tax=Devosia sp. TaxID=1871048 RepID=UPI0019F90D0B|nr:flagellin [Devosia sp.]MBF0680747.1 hypothetical protein [Devosia sp.]